MLHSNHRDNRVARGRNSGMFKVIPMTLFVGLLMIPMAASSPCSPKGHAHPFASERNSLVCTAISSPISSRWSQYAWTSLSLIFKSHSRSKYSRTLHGSWTGTVVWVDISSGIFIATSTCDGSWIDGFWHWENYIWHGPHWYITIFNPQIKVPEPPNQSTSLRFDTCPMAKLLHGRNPDSHCRRHSEQVWQSTAQCFQRLPCGMWDGGLAEENLLRDSLSRVAKFQINYIIKSSSIDWAQTVLHQASAYVALAELTAPRAFPTFNRERKGETEREREGINVEKT